MLFYAFSAFVLPMQAELGWSRPTLMGAFTTGLLVWGLSAYAVGAAIDRGQGRRVMVGGALLAAAGLAGWALARTPVQLYAAWALLGVGQACNLYEPAFAWLTRQFPADYRRAITALTLVGGLASTLSYPAVAGLQAAFGWRGALLALAAVMAGAVAPLQAWALARGGAGPARPAAVAVEAAVEATADVAVDVAADVAMARQAPAAADGLSGLGLDLGLDLAQALRERAFWLLTLAFGLHAFLSAALWAHVMPALAARGLSGPPALAILVWFGPAQVAGRLLLIGPGSRWPVRRVGITVLAAMLLALALFAHGPVPWGLLAFAGMFGIANGLITIVRGAVVPEWFGLRAVGRISGAMAAIGLLARAAAPWLSAQALVRLPGGYPALLDGLGLLGALAALAFAASGRPGRVRRRGPVGRRG